MVDKTGSQMARSLLDQAEKAYRRNNSHSLDLLSQNSDVTITEESAL
jgi:hypothetical protein